MTPFRTSLSASCILATLLGLGCASSHSTDTENENVADAHAESAPLRAAAPAKYGELNVTLQGDDLERWFTLRASLEDAFDDVCGDTICGGDYSNLSTVRILCSSTRDASQRLGACSWILGGSIEYVDGTTGELRTDTRAFTCPVPVAGTAKAMLGALTSAGDDALYEIIPGTDGSFYDALVSCFSGVVGEPAPEVPENPRFSELSDWFWETDMSKAYAWSDVRSALAHGFEQLCGDTFCEGEYSSIASLRFACTLDRNTQRVPACSWSFAGSAASVEADGAIAPETATWQCPVDVDATADELLSALSGEDPINAKLPGKQTSIFQALIGCL